MDFTRPDGRNLGWAEYGDPSGAPVVYLHGTPGSRLAHPAGEALDRIRLITVDRPGYVRSEPAQRPTLLGVADAVASLLASLDVKRFGVIGFSGGAPYALACGARFPDRLTGVVAAGLTGPDRELRTLPVRQRFQVSLLRTIPGLGRRHVRRAAAWYAEDPLRNHRRLLEAGQDTWMHANEDANLEGARQGAAGLVCDWLATDIHRWDFRLRDIPCRVLVWAGRHDLGRAVPDAPMVAARLANSEVRIVPDAAHTPSPTHWREILTWLHATGG